TQPKQTAAPPPPAPAVAQQEDPDQRGDGQEPGRVLDEEGDEVVVPPSTHPRLPHEVAPVAAAVVLELIAQPLEIRLRQRARGLEPGHDAARHSQLRRYRLRAGGGG